jgi:hypothetical protein
MLLLHASTPRFDTAQRRRGLFEASEAHAQHVRNGDPKSGVAAATQDRPLDQIMLGKRLSEPGRPANLRPAQPRKPAAPLVGERSGCGSPEIKAIVRLISVSGRCG